MCTKNADYLCMKKMICTKKVVKKMPPFSEIKNVKKTDNPNYP
jgi:hypothetical protein